LRWLLFALVVLLGLLQYRLWFADGSLAERHRLQLQIEEQARINRELEQRNAVLEREVLELQSGTQGVEQRAREQLGLIREGEIFYQFADPDAARPGLFFPPAPAGAGPGEPSPDTARPAGDSP
jgi:cell division protein FtsB